jgi:hypothetical protein
MWALRSLWQLLPRLLNWFLLFFLWVWRVIIVIKWDLLFDLIIFGFFISNFIGFSGYLYISYILSVLYEPLLLQPYDRPRSAYSKPSQNGFNIIWESLTMLIQNVAGNQSPSATEASFAMDGKTIWAAGG